MHPERGQQLRHPGADRASPISPTVFPSIWTSCARGHWAARVSRSMVGIRRVMASISPQRVLGDGVSVDTRRVGDRHSAGPAGGEVDVVGPGAPDGDEAEARAPRQDVIGELRVSADVDDDLRVADPPDELRLLVRAALGVHGDLAQLPQPRLGGGAGEGSREVIRDHDLETHRRSSLW